MKNPFSKPVIINCEEFGPRMKWEEVKQHLAGSKDQIRFKAIMQILEFHRQVFQRAVQDKSNCAAGQTQFEAGAAAGVAEVMQALTTLERGDLHYPDLEQWFDR